MYYILSRGFLALPTCRYIQDIFFDSLHVVSPWFPMVSDGSPWLSLVILGYPWLFLVILGYPWLYLVILGYTWLSTIQIYVKSFAPVLEIRTVFRADRGSFENKGGSRIWLLQILGRSFKFGSQMRILIILLKLNKFFREV